VLVLYVIHGYVIQSVYVRYSRLKLVKLWSISYVLSYLYMRHVRSCVRRHVRLRLRYVTSLPLRRSFPSNVRSFRLRTLTLTVRSTFVALPVPVRFPVSYRSITPPVRFVYRTFTFTFIVRSLFKFVTFIVIRLRWLAHTSLRYVTTVR